MLLVFLCAGFFLPGISTIPTLDREEALTVIASKQMVQSGNYLETKLQTEPAYKKPIGLNWLQAASVKIFNPDNPNEIWAYRIPSFLGATIAVVVTAMLGSLLFPPTTGFIAALLLMSCIILNVEARFATADAALLACVVVAQYALAKAYIAKDGEKPGIGNAVMFWLAIVAGFLIKGPLCLFIAFATTAVVWHQNHQAKGPDALNWFKSLYPATGFIFSALLIYPALTMVSVTGPDPAFTELLQNQSRYITLPGLHLAIMLGVFFPASLVVLLTIPDMWHNRKDPRVLFCLGWAVPAWLLFEFYLYKQPQQITPVYPAIAILAAKFLLDGLPSFSKRSLFLWAPIANGLWLLMASAIAAASIFIPFNMGGKTIAITMAAGFFFLSAMTAAHALLPYRRAQTVLIIALGSLVITTVGFGHTLPSLDKGKLLDHLPQIILEQSPREMPGQY